MQDYVNLEIIKKRGSSINPDIHHSKVFSSVLSDRNTNKFSASSINALWREILLETYLCCDSELKSFKLQKLFLNFLHSCICLKIHYNSSQIYIPACYYTDIESNFSLNFIPAFLVLVSGHNVDGRRRINIYPILPNTDSTL